MGGAGTGESGNGSKVERSRSKETDSVLAIVEEMRRLYRERVKMREEEISQLKAILDLRDAAIRQREDEVAGLRAQLTKTEEKARRTADELTAQFPLRVLELLQGAYTLKCTKCGAEVKTNVTEEQARQLLIGQPVQLLCPNPECMDEFPWGRERHSIPLTFGPMLKLKLALLGLL